MWRMAASLLIIGAGLGVGSTLLAFAQVGGDPAYAERAVFGVIALLAAGLTGFIPFFLRPHAGAAGAYCAISGLVGFVVINLYDINTFYFSALPFWLLGGILLALQSPSVTKKQV